MELKDPEFELLSSLEQIIFKDVPPTVTLNQKSNPFSEFARAMGVSVAMVLEWESKREKPTPAELKLMRLIQANPDLRKQLA